jgi:TPR repeat protein
MMKIANAHFVQGNNQKAFIKYLELASLGYSSALVNSAILADQFEVISAENIQYHRVNEILAEDDLYIFAKSINLPLEEDPLQYLFAIHSELLGESSLLKELVEPTPFRTKTIGNYIASKLYGYCKLEQEGYCYLRTGDFFYYGIYEEESYQEAYQNYLAAADITDSPDVIQAYAFFNLGYMNAIGIGRAVDEEKALKYFNESLVRDPLLPGITPRVVLKVVKVFHYLYHENDYE